MALLNEEHEYFFDQPGIYCIRVVGTFGEKLVDKFSDMSIKIRNRAENKPIITLVGKLPDQAALSGLLESLYEEHLTLISVEML